MAGATITGVEKIQALLQAQIDKYQKATAAALYQEAQDIMRASVRECPVDTGRLRATHYVGPPEITSSGQIGVRLGYVTDYGLYVHERTDLRHNSPTKAKFLEDPMNAAKGGYIARIAARAKANVERGVGIGILPNGNTKVDGIAGAAEKRGAKFGTRKRKGKK